MILSCSCQNEFQDKIYGKGKRVFNAMGSKGQAGYKCTVCKATNKSSVVKEEKKIDDTK